MSSVYTPTAVAQGNITIPSDGDAMSAASVNTPLQAVADGVKYLSDLVTPATTIMVPGDHVRSMTVSAPAQSPAVNALGQIVRLVAADVDGPAASNYLIYARILGFSTTSGSAKVYVVPLSEYLSAHKGRTLNGCTLYVQGGSGHGALPEMPRIALVRTGAALPESLCSTAWVLDTSANVGAYEAEHTIALTVNQNNVIDHAFQYYFLFQYEAGANARANTELHRVVLTVTTP